MLYTTQKLSIVYLIYLFVQVNAFKTLNKNTFTHNNEDSISYYNLSEQKNV